MPGVFRTAVLSLTKAQVTAAILIVYESVPSPGGLNVVAVTVCVVQFVALILLCCIFCLLLLCCHFAVMCQNY